MMEGVNDAAKQNGVELTIADENGDVGSQYTTMENFIQQKVDAS